MDVSIPRRAVIKFKAEGDPDWVEIEGEDYWELTVPNPGDCIVTVAPVEPTINQITVCDTYGSINYPTTTGVVYTLILGDGLQGAYTVRATPATGYEFDGPQFVDFSGNLGTYTDCAGASQNHSQFQRLVLRHTVQLRNRMNNLG